MIAMSGVRLTLHGLPPPSPASVPLRLSLQEIIPAREIQPALLAGRQARRTRVLTAKHGDYRYQWRIDGAPASEWPSLPGGTDRVDVGDGRWVTGFRAVLGTVASADEDLITVAERDALLGIATPGSSEIAILTDDQFAALTRFKVATHFRNCVRIDGRTAQIYEQTPHDQPIPWEMTHGLEEAGLIRAACGPLGVQGAGYELTPSGLLAWSDRAELVEPTRRRRRR